MPAHKTVNVFYNQVGETISALAVATSPSWTNGKWISKHAELGRYASIAYVITGTLPTALEAKVELSNDNGTTVHGSVPVIDSISGGIITVLDGIFDLPVTSGYHRFDIHIRTGLSFRVSLRKEGGDATTVVLAHADLDLLT